MAFGYEMLNGRQGAAGYCREANGKTEVRARGFRPGERCELYALLPDRAEKRDEQAADGNGQAVFHCSGEAPLFVAVDGKVRLWQGGEENYLRACEWLKREETKTGETPNSISPEAIQETEEQTKEEPKEAHLLLARDLEDIQLSPEPAEKEKTAEPKPEETPTNTEPAYTLRSPSSGEPVDALPD